MKLFKRIKRIFRRNETMKHSFDMTGRIMPRVSLEMQWRDLNKQGLTNMSCDEYININTQLHGWKLI